MTPDMARLCDAVEIVCDHLGMPTSSQDQEAIVHAMLKQLREVSPEGFEAMEVAMKRPRMHVGHKASDDVRGAYIALDAYVDHILDTKARRAVALSDLAEIDRDLL